VVVSIVSYRTAKLVARCLASLREERVRANNLGIDVTVVVVDNASGDADELEQVIVDLGIATWTSIVRSEENGGFAYGNNLVMRRAYESGQVPDYFWWLNPDTEVRANSIAELVKFLVANPTAGIAGSSLESESGERWPYAFRFPTLLSEFESGLQIGLVTRLLDEHRVLRTMGDSPECVDWMPGASMMVRRELVEAIGGMDSSYFLYYEETDYCRRVREAGWTIWYVPASRVMHSAGGSTGVTTKRDRPRRLPSYWYESRRRYFQKNFGLTYAVAVDATCVAAMVVGNIKSIALGRQAQIVPHQVRDTLSHSVMFPKNRQLAPTQSFTPARRPA